ncbi:hypothetical protein SAMN05192533_104254 [Mesobacillus persicus]|uniref:Uncharacterized protein n=1 Tax=Mesobacillus persicus TaxID=930146 RepID=A0A1H8A5K8_9BACI|nr:hypothetical protein [Mesobacillus persicus]SEM65871.1 hypothetical protein SAMN05192533_104254 [Mesobacillus persicus]
MKDLIVLLAEIINTMHDLIGDFSKNAGWELSDKDLHLWVFGIVGIIAFLFVHVFFKFLAQYSVTAISFIYTFTVILVIVFAIEIQQKITGRGQMELDDAVISLWGFLLFFTCFLLIKGLYLLTKKLLKRTFNTGTNVPKD